MRKALLLGTVGWLLAMGGAQAAEPESCATVRLAEPGWSDLALTTGIAEFLLESLGYGAESQVLGIPVIYQAMENGQLDAFLGYWDPAMETYYVEFRDRGTVETVSRNLEGAKYTWAVPKHVAEAAGIVDIADLAKHRDEFGGKVYGIEPGSNQLMFDIIADPKFGLAGWEVVESSEQGMLSQVQRAVDSNEFIAFQAWAPHPMNVTFDIVYLTGGDAYYGPNYGGATVHTQVRKGYLAECPNVGRLLTNLSFTVPQESRGMAYITADGMEPVAAGRQTILDDPAVLAAWLDGVTAKDGGDAMAAVQAALK
jgi:glycine betaine/proline transport system substrate-binding protein